MKTDLYTKILLTILVLILMMNIVKPLISTSIVEAGTHSTFNYEKAKEKIEPLRQSYYKKKGFLGYRFIDDTSVEIYFISEMGVFVPSAKLLTTNAGEHWFLFIDDQVFQL